MKKITKITNYGTEHGLNVLQAGLSAHEQKALDGENHSIHFIDGHSLEANGIVVYEGGSSNYRFFVEVGGCIEFQSYTLDVTSLQYPHIMVKADGKERPIHVVKYVASKIAEMV